MNAKTAKALRKALRTHAPVDTPEAGHISQSGRTVWVPDYAAGLNLDGTPKYRQVLLEGTARNTEGTLRSAYRSLKKLPAGLLRSVL
jgi:hypothetical protein